MHRLFLILTLIPAGLFGQAPNQVKPLEYRPLQARVIRKPPSFAQSLAAPIAGRLGAVSQAEMDAVVRDPRLPVMGIERAIDRRARTGGQWVTLNDGTSVWRWAVQSEGAQGMRVEFTAFHVGAGEVWIYSEDRSQFFGPYTGDGIDGSGEFWSNTVFADAIIVEYRPEAPRDDVPFSVLRVLHRLSAAQAQAMSAGSCELDVSCYPTWSPLASGVGLYYFQKGGAGYACSGGLVNNSNNDGKPYFLTAGHCVSDAATARTVDVFWKDQTSTCNGGAPSLSGLPQTLGATYLASASIGNGDYSLMLLSALPAVNLTFFGWDGSTTALKIGDATTGIHHPQADYTRIAFGVRDPDMTAQVGSDIAPASLYYQIRETSGRIEAGSSGSPLFDAAKMVVGTLTYGPAGDACSVSPFSAGYGRFSAALPALSSYLSQPAPPPPPPTSGATVTATPGSIKLAWTIGTPAPAAQSIQLTTTSTSTIAVSAKASQAWIGLSATSLSVSKTAPASLTVTLAVQGFLPAGANTGTITLTGTGISQTISMELDAAAPAAVKGGPATIIPLVLDGSGAATTFTIVNPYATTTLASVSFLSGSGAALALPLAGSATASVLWQNVTIPPYGTATVATAGTSAPQKQGMAVIQSADAAKRVGGWAQVNADVIAPAAAAATPFVVPFDATGTAPTTLYLYNPAASGSITLSLTVYDGTGTAIGSGSITVPAQQEGVIPMTKTAAVFGGKKGTLLVSGTAAVAAMAIHTAGDGRLSAVPVQTVTAQ